MRILITGAGGTLGRTLQRVLREEGRAHAVAARDHARLEVTDAKAVRAAVAERQAEVVLHCAAWTDVDGCEGNPRRARRVHVEGARVVAEACRRAGARLIAFSTDYVFDGALGRPYTEADPPRPINAYGETKRAGEEAILAVDPNALIARTAWLYGEGGRGFVPAILARARAKPGEPLRVVRDQIGCPTSCDALAGYVANHLLRAPLTGIIHLACTGGASRFEFAQRLVRMAGIPARIEPCESAAHLRPARRPADTRLANTAIAAAGLPPMPSWEEGLRAYFAVGEEAKTAVAPTAARQPEPTP